MEFQASDKWINFYVTQHVYCRTVLSADAKSINDNVILHFLWTEVDLPAGQDIVGRHDPEGEESQEDPGVAYQIRHKQEHILRLAQLPEGLFQVTGGGHGS